MNLRRTIMSSALALLVAACATPAAPQPFELIDEANVVYAGSLDRQTQGMTVGIGERVFNGFYVLGVESVSATAYPFPQPFRRPWIAPIPMETRSMVVSNRARAHLKSSDGGNLACEFTIDGSRAVGTCKTPEGKGFQFVAGQ